MYYSLISSMKKAIAFSYDADALAFFTSTGITDTTQKSAVNTLVLDLKSYGIWSKMKAIYPMVGGTATTHKYNLKDPRDLDASFRLVFNGGWTHSSDGALPNGINTYANTKLTPSIALTNANHHISFYSRTDPTPINSIEMGVGDISGFYSPSFRIRLSGFYGYTNTFFYVSGNTSNYATINGTNADARGFFVGNILNTSSRKTYKNGIVNASNTSTITNSLGTGPIYLGAYNSQPSKPEFYSNRQCAFASIGDGLTDTESANFYTAVQNFNTTLSRQV